VRSYETVPGTLKVVGVWQSSKTSYFLKVFLFCLLLLVGIYLLLTSRQPTNQVIDIQFTTNQARFDYTSKRPKNDTLFGYLIKLHLQLMENLNCDNLGFLFAIIGQYPTCVVIKHIFDN
jgi:hypothetical protein